MRRRKPGLARALGLFEALLPDNRVRSVAKRGIRPTRASRDPSQLPARSLRSGEVADEKVFGPQFRLRAMVPSEGSQISGEYVHTTPPVRVAKISRTNPHLRGIVEETLSTNFEAARPCQ